MSIPSPRLSAQSLLLILAMAITALALAAQAEPARAQLGPIPNPCDLPGPGYVCDAVGGLATDVAGAAGDFIMRGVTVWVTNAAVWVTGSGWPDVLIALGLAILFLRSAMRVLTRAWRELQLEQRPA